MKQSVIFVFIDGLGLGLSDQEHNPLTVDGINLLANFRDPGWTPPDGGGRPGSLPQVHRTQPLPEGVQVIATDASLGVPGLPQSATGQTTLFTGVNGATTLGGNHTTGFPGFTLKKLLKRHSILKAIRERGKTPVFLNAYSSLFFDDWDAIWKKGYLSATSWATRAADIPFMNFEDLVAGRALMHDITQETMSHSKWIKPEEVQPPRTPQEAGKILAASAEQYDFVLFEFFLTDKVGHRQDFPAAVREVLKLEAFLLAVLEELDPSRHTLIVTSDHGNVEDLSRKTHTLNPVPTILYGNRTKSLSLRLTSLEAFAAGIMATLFHEDS